MAVLSSFTNIALFCIVFLAIIHTVAALPAPQILKVPQGVLQAYPAPPLPVALQGIPPPPPPSKVTHSLTPPSHCDGKSFKHCTSLYVIQSEATAAPLSIPAPGERMDEQIARLHERWGEDRVLKKRRVGPMYEPKDWNKGLRKAEDRMKALEWRRVVPGFYEEDRKEATVEEVRRKVVTVAV